MPFDRDVTIDFNADISGYSASMAQMIQQTSQYSAAADGMIGKIGKLNSVILAGVKSVSAFTQTNKVATAQAAAYQQQLSKIETSAKVTGKSFSELEKTTKGLAKDFPIGMKQAVEQVESLQEAGVTTNKEINSLAKTFTKLGAATGTFGPELGQNMLQLNRTFQTGTNTMEKYADSLTTVTHMYGANAGAVTSFAKSIAPVAATVGMSETSVIGLSTAFSRLGEDGYAAANTFNKVMLDMSKSIREGTPEAKIYAEVMGTTSESLKAAWEGNPAEGFIDFVEAIKKQGQGGIRSLEQLGLEGVRTQKTIIALSNSGNMREIVQKAQSSYGSGATGMAAETALGGVNDQLTKMNETMSQTAATAGKPFLGFLEAVLAAANALSKALSDLVESDAMQGLAKAVGIAGTAFAGVKILNSTAVTAAFGKNIVSGIFGGQMMRDYRLGKSEGMEDPTAVSRARRLGAYQLAYFGPGSGAPFMQDAWRNARNFANMTGNMAALYARSNASIITKALGEESITTPEGDRFKAAMTRMDTARQSGIGWRERRKIISAATSEAMEAARDMAAMENGVGNAAKEYLNQTKQSLRFGARAGGAAVRGLGQIGSALTMGMVGGAGAAVIGGVGLVAGAGYMYQQGRKKEDEAAERGGKDAYRMFNEFAEKAGIATKGLVSFSEAVAESTSKIAAESKTREDAYALTEKERLQAMNPSYERAYETRGGGFWGKVTNWGGPDIEKEALRVRGMVGANASPEAINRIQMDLTSKFGEQFSTSVMDTLKKWEVEKLSSEELQGKWSNAESRSRTLGIFGNTESAEFAEFKEAERARVQKREADIMGQESAQAGRFAAGSRGLGAYEEARQGVSSRMGPNPQQFQMMEDAKKAMIAGLSLSQEDSKKVNKTLDEMRYQEGPLDMAEVLRKSGLENMAAAYQQGSLAPAVSSAGGYGNMTPGQIASLGVSQGETLAGKSSTNMGKFGIEIGSLAGELASTNKVIRDSGMTFDEWQEAGQLGANELQKAYADVKDMPSDVNAQNRLANLAAEHAIAEARKTGGGAAAARAMVVGAMTTETGEEIPGMKQALALIDRSQGLIDSGMSTWEQMGQTIEKGVTATRVLTSPEAAGLTSAQREDFQAQEAAGVAAMQARQQQVRTYQLQMRRMQEDFNTSQLRMNRNYELQMQYQAEDFGKQRKYMIQDYHKGVRRAEEDFYTQRQRAQRDFDKQVKRQSEETAKNMFDPYARIGPQIVTDIAVLQQSLLEQNKSVSDQLSSVKQLSGMGLSKNAIDQLKLMDPSQNQQVQRLLADAQTDPAAIKKINDLISKRIKLGTQLNTSEYNKAFSNMKEDFATSMDDMGDDFEKNMKRGEKDFKQSLKRNGDAFATAQGRAAAAHNQALSDMDADNKKAITRAEEDLTGMAKEFTSTYTDVQKDFLKDLANLPSNLSPTTKAAIQKVLEDEAKAIEEANKKATTTAETQHGREKTAGLLGAPVGGIEGGEDMQGVDGPTAGRGNYSGNWQYYRGGGYHGGADIGVPNGTPVYSVISGKVKVSTTARNGSTQNPSGSYGKHVMISDGKHDFWYAHLSSHGVMVGETVTPGSYLGKSGNTGNTRPAGGGHHLHFEVRPAGAGHGHAKNPAPWLADGGIALQHTLAHIGESGKEAVVPLNDRGMKFLSDAMSKAARYWQSTSASGTRAQGYSAPVTNNLYSYDQRTQFMGEVHVESQDPEDMARKLAQRERRNRLARKAGSAA